MKVVFFCVAGDDSRSACRSKAKCCENVVKYRICSSDRVLIMGFEHVCVCVYLRGSWHGHITCACAVHGQMQDTCCESNLCLCMWKLSVWACFYHAYIHSHVQYHMHCTWVCMHAYVYACSNLPFVKKGLVR